MFLNAEVSKIFPLTNYMFQQKVQYKKHILKDKEKKTLTPYKRKPGKNCFYPQ